MKAEWTDNTDREICLCCGSRVKEPVVMRSPEHAEALLGLLEAIGFTRESLLTRHREQIDYQTPGFAAWLQGQ